MERVIVESPYAGKEDWQIIINELYCEFCLNDCIVNKNEAPFASHLLYTRDYVLRDDIPEERKLGIKAGFEWRDVTEKTVFYCDLGMSPGMIQGIEDVKKKGKKHEIRCLPDEHWDLLIEACEESDIEIPKRIFKKEI